MGTGVKKSGTEICAQMATSALPATTETIQRVRELGRELVMTAVEAEVCAIESVLLLFGFGFPYDFLLLPLGFVFTYVAGHSHRRPDERYNAQHENHVKHTHGQLENNKSSEGYSRDSSSHLR
jgi:hypothetical protein